MKTKNKTNLTPSVVSTAATTSSPKHHRAAFAIAEQLWRLRVDG